MKKGILQILILLLVLAFCTNCKINRNVYDSSKFVKWRNELAPKVDSHFLHITEYTNGKMGFLLDNSFRCDGNATSESYESVSFFYDSLMSKIYSGKLVNVGEHIQIGEHKIEADVRNAYWCDSHNKNSQSFAKLFGTNVRFRTDGNDSLGYPAIDTTIYIPKKLNLKLIGKQREHHYNLADGLEMVWDADTANKNGIIINVQAQYYLHNGNIGSNPDSLVPNAPQVIIVANDDGHYKFKKSDFKNFPDRISLYVNVARGSVVIVNKDGIKTKLSGLERNYLHCVVLQRK